MPNNLGSVLLEEPSPTPQPIKHGTFNCPLRRLGSYHSARPTGGDQTILTICSCLTGITLGAMMDNPARLSPPMGNITQHRTTPAHPNRNAQHRGGTAQKKILKSKRPTKTIHPQTQTACAVPRPEGVRCQESSGK